MKRVDAGDAVSTLLDLVEQRLTELSGGDPTVQVALRKQVISKLASAERRAAARRRAMNARKFIAQRGRCPSCGAPLRGPNMGRHGRDILPPDMPLYCASCARRRVGENQDDSKV